MTITIPDVNVVWSDDEQKARVLNDLFAWADKHVVELHFDVEPDVPAGEGEDLDYVDVDGGWMRYPDESLQ